MKILGESRVLSVLMATVLLWGGYTVRANAAKTFYYKVTAKVSDAGGGKVFASEKSNNNPSYAEESTVTGSVTVNDDAATSGSVSNFYLYRQANTGYYLVNWTDQAGTSYNAPSSLRTTAYYSNIRVNLNNITSTDQNNPTEFTYTANYKENKDMFLQITVKSEDEAQGKVAINTDGSTSTPSDFYTTNTINYTVSEGAPSQSMTLFYQPSEGYYFDNWTDQSGKTYHENTGWFSNNETNITPTSTSYDSSNPTQFTYTAHFLKYKHFYYKVDATATEGGKVYVSDESTTSPAYAASSSKSAFEEEKQTETSSTKSFYLYAQPDEGYYFNNWSLNGQSVNTTATYRASASSTSEDEANPAATSYVANFGKYNVFISAPSEQAKYGDIAIDNEKNAIGDKVTLTATPYGGLVGASFKDWIGPDGSVVSTENPYSFTVSDENKGKYYAEFEGGKDYSKGVYVVIQSNYYNTRKNFGIRGTSGTATTSMGSWISFERCPAYSFFLAPSASDATHASPAFVLKLTGNSVGQNGGLDNMDASVQGTSMLPVFKNYARWAANKHGWNSDYYVNMINNATIKLESHNTTNNPNSYIISSSVAGNGVILGAQNAYSTPVEQFGNCEVPDAINDRSANRDYSGHDANWYVTPFTEDDNTTAYFGAMPSEGEKLGDSYYTTMYTVFPYKCLDGVKAYTVDKINSDNTLHLSEIESGVVPSNTPVVLKCKTTKPATNRLLPLIDEPAALTQTNLLKGELWLLQDETKTPEENGRTKFDASTMRVLSTTDGTFKNQNNSGYYVTYTTTNGTTTATGTANTEYPYIVNNTAYLPVSDGAADSYSLALNVNGNDAAADNWTNAVSGHNDAASVAFTRTLSSNKWQTLCLPFDVSEDELQAAFGEDVDLEEFNKSTVSGDNIVMSFKKASSIVAGKPYFIKPSQDFTSYVFDNMTMTQTDAESVDLGAGYVFKGTAQYNAEDIAGTYGSRARFTKYNATDNVIELITPAANSSKIKPTRCYFVYPANGNGVKSLSFSFDDDPTTAISEVINGVKSTTRTDNRIFNLAGQFVGNDISKLPHGVYIKNGKKITK